MQDKTKCFVQKEEQEIFLLLFLFMLFIRDKPYKSYARGGNKEILKIKAII